MRKIKQKIAKIVKLTKIDFLKIKLSLVFL